MKFSQVASAFSLLSASAVVAAPVVDPLGDGYIGQKSGFDADVRVVNAADTAPFPTSIAAAQETASPEIVEVEDEMDEYVVILDVDKPITPEVANVLSRLNLSSEDTQVRYTFENSAFRGFTASMKSERLDMLDADEEVAMVEQSVKISSLDTRGGTPWGLQRVSSSAAVSGSASDTSYTYNFDGADSTQGKGVDIYVIDTGVNVNHQVFQGRAQQGFSFEEDVTDGDGHGTHVAGTAAGAYFGVASGANIWAVKVLGADGSGSSSDTIAGMNWVINHHDQRKTEPGFVGAIMSMSWGLAGPSSAVTQAIKLATDNGIHVSVAAGNSAEDSCGAAPANSGGQNGPAITVGSIGIDDDISSFSNTGSCNDVYGPGENILSAWNTADNMVNFLSGTSMACPHVTGVMAYLMAENADLAQNPAAMKAFLAQNGLPNVPQGTANGADPKILVNNGQRTPSRMAKRTITIRDEVTGPITAAKRFISSLLRKSDSLEFILKRAQPDGPQVRY